ncbi:MAG: YiiD C-terminal domain-containing protein [Bacteroidota bacterium]
MNVRKFRRIVRFLNWYPPFVGAGVRIKSTNEDLTQFVVQMKLRWYNRNLFGTHFGGSLYAMCDPFFVFILIANLGKAYVIWDKSALIRFRKPGKGKMTAIFEIPQEKIAAIRQEMQQKTKATFWFTATIKNELGEIIAEVEKEIYVRRKI